MRYILFLKAKHIVRSGIRTHAHIRGPERSVSWWTRRWYLESGALDHSAILTADPFSLIYSENSSWCLFSFYFVSKNMIQSSHMYLKIRLFRCITNFPVFYLLNCETANRLIDYICYIEMTNKCLYHSRVWSLIPLQLPEGRLAQLVRASC